MPAQPQSTRLRARQRLGKYRIGKTLAKGGFAAVYQGYDTIERLPVAIKVPDQHLLDDEAMKLLAHEVRLIARLEHPGILPVKNATIEEGIFLIVYPLGEETLDARLRRRLPIVEALSYADQLLDVLAYAHQRRVIHCDIKPDNIILFDGQRVRLTDFGIARVAAGTRTIASGAGTVGYIAPEQALGRPSLRSDVFSIGLVIWQMLSGQLPEWPYRWPLPGHERMRRSVHRDMVAVLRRAMELDERKRFKNAGAMLQAFRAARRKTRGSKTTRRKSSKVTNKERRRSVPTWQEVRLLQYQKSYAKVLGKAGKCSKCSGPVSEPMHYCPWCSIRLKVWKGETDFPIACGHCHRGNKLDWRYCAWCYSAGVPPENKRQYDDKRYTARCSNRKCPRRDLMPFMRYCPWCHTKVKKPWPIEGSRRRCKRCRWGITDYWNNCAWCGKSCGNSIANTTTTR